MGSTRAARAPRGNSRAAAGRRPRGHVESVCRLLAKAGTGGNLVTDAQMAALAQEYGATAHSTDGDFGRFAKIDWENPSLE